MRTAWGKRIAIVAVALGLVTTVMIVRAELHRAAEDREMLRLAGGNLFASVATAHHALEAAALGDPDRRIDNIRRAAVHVGKSKIAIRFFTEEARRQEICTGTLGHFASGISAEDIVQYRGQGVDPELDRRLGILLQHTGILSETLSLQLFQADKRRIQSVLNGIQLPLMHLVPQ